MLPSYFMAGSNVLIFSIVFCTFLLLKKKFPHLHIYSLTFLFFFSLLPLISIARIGTYESGDLSINVYKTMELVRAIRDGNIIPTWAGNLNATYGYPLFIFTYPLPYFLGAFFHLVGFSFISSVKMVLVLSFLSSGIFMYYFLRVRLSERASFFGSILYLYTPYHLVNMHFRVDIGEMCAIAIVPLIFLSLEKISFKKVSPLWITIGSFSIGLLILSHQAVSLSALPFTIVYLFLINKFAVLKKIGWRYFIMYLSGVLLSGFYVFPLLYLKQFTIQSLGVSMSFVQLRDLVYSPYRYGFLFQGPSGELSFLLGYTQLLLIIVGIWMIWKRNVFKNHKKFFLFAISGIGILMFFMLGISKPLWFTIPLIKNFQFSYRLLSVFLFFIALLGALISEYIKKQYLFILLLFFTIFLTILNWGNRRTISVIDDRQLAQGIPISTYYGEGLNPAAPKWVNPNHIWAKDIPEAPIEVITGKAEIKIGARKVNEHHYIFSVEEPSEFKENTLYFPDWTILANKKVIKSNYLNPRYPGIMTFHLPKGTYTVDVIYKNPFITKLSRFLSLSTALSLLIFMLFSYRNNLLNIFKYKKL